MSHVETNNPVDLTSLSLLPDGSLTLAEQSAHQLFHNRSGAWVESHTLYLAHTLHQLASPAMAGRGSTLRVVEGCFGLGYNTWALLLAWWSGELAGVQQLGVVGCDTDLTLSALWGGCVASAPHPAAEALAWAVTAAMAGVEGFGGVGDGVQFTLTHPVHGGEATVDVYGCDLATLLAGLRPAQMDVAFHDPFSREVHPKLWSGEVFESYARILRPGGVVITYSCAGVVRRALVASGFDVHRTGPIGGKRSGGVVAVRH